MTAQFDNAAPGSVTIPNVGKLIDDDLDVSHDADGYVYVDIDETYPITPTVVPGIVKSVDAGSVNVRAQTRYSLPKQAAQTITPKSTAQQIASGKFLTGTQTIEAVTHNLSASDLKQGVTVKIGTATDDDSVATIVGTRAYNPFGDELTLLESYASESWLLKNTSYNGWAPSTTAKTIVSSATKSSTQVLDLDQYEYLIKWIVTANIAYASGTTKKGAPVKQITVLYQHIHRKPSSFSNLSDEIDNYNYCVTLFTAPLMDYYDTSGSHKVAWTGSYGFYGAATAATFSSSTSLTPTLTVKRPAMTARCSTTYFTTTMAAAVDQNTSTMSCRGYLYRMKKGSFGRAAYDDVIEEYNA